MRADGEPEASGLEIAFRCPVCGPRSRLVETNNAIHESRCLLCAGSHLPSYGVDQVLREVNGPSRRELQTAPPSEDRGVTACPGCEGPTDQISIRDTKVDFCRRCGSAWFEANALFSATAGRFGVRSTQDRRPARPLRRAPPVVAARRRAPSLIVIAGVAGSILGSAGYFAAPYLRAEVSKAAPGSAERAAATEPRPASGAGSAKESVADYPFGGQTSAWWSARLTALKAAEGERAQALYALTKKRALANGLVVDDTGPQVRAEPSEALLADIGRRLAQQSSARASEASTAQGHVRSETK